jgi:HTH-type transcriptional regulator/antitoxin HigA
VREFPLRPLRTGAQIATANERAIHLLNSKPETEMDAGEKDYLDALSVLIQDAERDILAAITRQVRPTDLLKHLMEQRAMTVNDLGKIVGGQPAASLILQGKRSISKSQIRRLADFFSLSPAAFMD